MAEIIASLPRNPLPDAFIVTPQTRSRKRSKVWPRPSPPGRKVAHVQLDSAWVKRFDALLRLGKLVVMLLGVLFAGALVTITFNTIRLQILAQAAEIELAKLIGATDSYIQRPLHYFGHAARCAGGLVCGGIGERRFSIPHPSGSRTRTPLRRQLRPARSVGQ
jgi:cell division transport system permease protein